MTSGKTVWHCLVVNMTNLFLKSFIFVVICVASVAAQSGTKQAYAILMDNTGSLKTQFFFEQNLAKGILKHSARGNVISIYSFATVTGKKNDGPVAGIRIVGDWSSDAGTLTKHVDSIGTVGGQTTLIDAIKTVAESIKRASRITREHKYSKEYCCHIGWRRPSERNKAKGAYKLFEGESDKSIRNRSFGGAGY